ncbi:hypothetical protein DID88_006256 [Monilinia fructigena]|uniref:Cation/H+ exchanger domain-containing protein n=1 Tax=Monilinia fructigena TaxID=38457 RepID=A0A395J2U4_9HELO|nr:hypothetical protein DID88_006256 [Monilinia fructigena]
MHWPLEHVFTPTDPVLSNSIVKGKFADKNIPKELQKIIVAESGANDGLGYPYLFLALYLIKYTGEGGAGQTGGASKAIGLWFGETWAYTIVLSVIYGATVGWIAKELLHWAEEKKFVDRESFLHVFIAGNVFTWDDWFRLETLDDSLQPTIDMLLNLSIFIWFGAICPWTLFSHNDVIPIYRLLFLGVLILLFRRLPIVFVLHKFIHQIDEKRQAIFVGFFGPIGVSAIFYLYISLEFLEKITVDGEQREDAAHLAEVITVVVWQIGLLPTETLSRAFTTQTNSQTDLTIGARVYSSMANVGVLRERRRNNARDGSGSGSGTRNGSVAPALSSGTSSRQVFRIGGTVIKSGGVESESRSGGGGGNGMGGGMGNSETIPDVNSMDAW